MAYVRKTNALCEAVIGKLHAMKENEEDSCGAYHDMDEVKTLQSDHPIYKRILEKVDQLAWGEHKHLQSVIPESWLNKDNLYFSIAFQDEDPTEREVMNFHYSGYIQPPKTDIGHELRWDNTFQEQYLTYSLSELPDRYKQLVAENTKIRDAKQAVIDKFLEIRGKLKKFMDRHASLNSMLKELPTFELYVPQEYMDRYHMKEDKRKVDSAKKKEEFDSIGIDVDELTAIGVTHKLT